MDDGDKRWQRYTVSTFGNNPNVRDLFETTIENIYKLDKACRTPLYKVLNGDK